MKIIHTADLHLGQVLYQNYDRSDEHDHFFQQLKEWCKAEKPDALLVSGDVFDILIPSINTKKRFNEFFVGLQKELPEMHVVITAGNHDSASRIQADHDVWSFSNTHLIGVAPSLTVEDGWQENYIIELPAGFIIAMPFMQGDRAQQLQSLLDIIAERNTEGKPVVMMGHLAVTGLDPTGHNFEVGKIETQNADRLGKGYDYLALGHIHKPQTISHPEDCMAMDVTYPAPVIRYSGSALHVSCDEQYPHTVSLVEIDKHGGNVHIRQLRIDELRHFYTLPAMTDPAFTSEEEVLDGLKDFCQAGNRGYVRLRIEYAADISSNFNQQVYDILATYGDEVRFNPKIIWVGQPAASTMASAKTVFEVSELQDMDDPLDFIEKTKEQYPGLDFSILKEMFKEVEAEIRRFKEEGKAEKTGEKSSTAEVITETKKSDKE
ncbi:MAG: exonuclease SbcCD subunit D [Bacteroidales bacterium]|nr:exonuclease SbcCD subunit D [Bacteroidales bacterium]